MMTEVIVQWQGDLYLGTIKEIAPGIVLLEKSIEPLPEEDTSIDPDRLLLNAEAKLNLSVRKKLLRCINRRLTFLTAEQMDYLENRYAKIISAVSKTKI